jgi:hypothetical protein
MKKILFTILSLLVLTVVCRGNKNIKMSSPGGNIRVVFNIDKTGTPSYTAFYLDTAVIIDSPLGVVRKDADFSRGLKMVSFTGPEEIDDNYTLLHGKKRDVSYHALRNTVHLKGISGERIDIIFQLSDDGFAFRYGFPGSSAEMKFIAEEKSSFCFAEGAYAWIQPRAASKSGWNQTNPSYEENYMMEVLLSTVVPDPNGYVFPALFRSGNCWVNLTESWPDRNYCGSHLAKGEKANEVVIAFPESMEGYTGSAVYPQSHLPWLTPWRIVTMGNTPGVITESTHGTDLALPAVEGDFSYVKPGRAAWSWALMKDRSVNFEVQKRFINYASEMGWEYCLIDVNWDKTIGWEKIAELAQLAETKNVGLILWYNSAGDWNTVTYHPKDRLLTHESRTEEFSRLESLGIRGIKVDFFGGDGQSMLDYYQDILEDAHRYRLVVNCHGSTMPRGLQRTWPNLVSMEAIRGFEFATFDQATADRVPLKAATLAFTRNAFDPMDFTPVCFTEYDNFRRITGNGAELALAVLFLSGVQHYAETPSGMATVPQYVKEMMAAIPVSWDETRFIDGYPGRYLVLARRSGNDWYIAGVNAMKEPVRLALSVPVPPGTKGKIITEGETGRSFSSSDTEADASGIVNAEIKPDGGFVMLFKNINE